MVEYMIGGMFDSSCAALCNAVNCRGVSGAGLALQIVVLLPPPAASL